MSDRVCFLHFQCDKHMFPAACYTTSWSFGDQLPPKKNPGHIKAEKMSLESEFFFFFSEHPINFVAKITTPCPGLCLPAVNSCGSHSWQAIRRSREDRCWATLNCTQQQQLHMFEIMLWFFSLIFIVCLDYTLPLSL